MNFSLTETKDADICDTVTLLGITLDKKLTWSSHVDNICARLSRVLYLLRHLKGLVPSTYLRSAYYAFFNSILLYGICLWGNSSSVSRVLLLQKKAIRILTGSQFDAHCRPLFASEKILTVINLYIYIYIYHCLLHIKRNFTNYCIRRDLHHYSTRGNHNIVESNVRLTKSKKWFECMAVSMFNKLPENVQSLDYKLFKRSLYNWLTCNPFYKTDEYFSSIIIIR